MDLSILAQTSNEVWRRATESLIDGLRCAATEEVRVAIVNRLARQLGDAGYPVFIKLLLIAAESDDVSVKALLASTLGECLRRDDLPGGSLTAWGGSGWTRPDFNPTGSGLSTEAPARSLGPIEYLTAWNCQRSQWPFLSDDTYRSTVMSLLNLIECDDSARELYGAWLRAEAEGLEGSYSRTTRERLNALATGLTRGDPAERIIADAMAASWTSPPSTRTLQGLYGL